MKTQYTPGTTLELTRTTDAKAEDNASPDAAIWIVKARLGDYRAMEYGPFTRPQAMAAMNHLAPKFGDIERAYSNACLTLDTFETTAIEGVNS